MHGRLALVVTSAAAMLAACCCPVTHASCSTANQGAYLVGGTCQEYQGTCAPYVGNKVFVPTNETLKSMQDEAVKNYNLLGEVCELMTEQFSCMSQFLGCDEDTQGDTGQGIPRLYCDSACRQMWETCNNAESHYSFDAYANFFLNASYAGTYISVIPYCESGVLDFVGPTSRYRQFPHPGDRWGGRPNPSGYPFVISGLVGVPKYPIDTYSYVLPDGRNISGLTCTPPKPNGAVTERVTLGLITCESPSLNVNGTCQMPCPYPIYTKTELEQVGYAFAIPGAIGCALCVFVILDSMFVILLATGGNMRRVYRKYLCGGRRGGEGGGVMSMFFSSHGGGAGGVEDAVSGGGGTSSGSSTGNREQKNQLHASTMYALLGGVLGVVYFFLGPYVTLTKSYNVMCDGPVIDFDSIFSGKDPSSVACQAQRVAPFVLQAIFNLIMFAIAKVLMVVSDRARRFDQTQKSVYNALLLVYCVGLPVACLVASRMIDFIDDGEVTAPTQMARQAAICTPRFHTVEQEFVVVFLPYITTGFIVVVLSVNVAWILWDVRRKTQHMNVSKSASSVALEHLIVRLVVLGLCTLVVLIVVIVSSSVATSSLMLFTPRLSNWWGCTQGCRCAPCETCQSQKRELLKVKLDPTVLEIQLCAMSMITVLLGGFFTAQSLSRLARELRDGTLQKKTGMLCGRGAKRGGSKGSTSNGSAPSPKSPGGGGLGTTAGTATAGKSVGSATGGGVLPGSGSATVVAAYVEDEARGSGAAEQVEG